MSNYANTQDLKIAMLEACGELTDGTSEYDSTAIKFINRAHQACLSGGADLGLDVGEPYPWAVNKYPKVLTLLPAITTLSVTAENNSTGITFGYTPPNNLKDWMIQIDGKPEAYRIDAHSGTSTSATLDGVFVRSSGTYSCKIFKIDYDLDSGILRLCSPFVTAQMDALLPEDCDIKMIDEAEFMRTYQLTRMRDGTPNRCAQVYKTNDTMQPRVRFNSVPINLTRVEYKYVPVPADLTDSTSSYPLVPLDHRITLMYYSAYYLLLDKNDTRAAEYRELARAGMMAMKRAGQVEKINTGSDYGRYIPRPDLLRGRTRRWWF